MRYLGTPLFGFFLFNDAGIEVGINGHLLTRHGVQSKASGHFGYAAGAFGNHDEVNDGDHNKDHNTNRNIAANHELTKGLNHLTRSVGSIVAINQNNAGGGNV